MNSRDKQHDHNFDPGTMVPVGSKPGLFLADVHGGYVYRTDPVTWSIGPYHRVPFVGLNGGGSQAMPDVMEASQARKEAAEWGLFATRAPVQSGANFDVTPLPGDPSLPVHRFAIGDHIPGIPLGLTSGLGHGRR